MSKWTINEWLEFFGNQSLADYLLYYFIVYISARTVNSLLDIKLEFPKFNLSFNILIGFVAVSTITLLSELILTLSDLLDSTCFALEITHAESKIFSALLAIVIIYCISRNERTWFSMFFKRHALKNIDYIISNSPDLKNKKIDNAILQTTIYERANVALKPFIYFFLHVVILPSQIFILSIYSGQSLLFIAILIILFYFYLKSENKKQHGEIDNLLRIHFEKHQFKDN